MLPEDVVRQIDPMLSISFRDSERRRSEEVLALETELARKGRTGSGLHKQGVPRAFEDDLERRGRAVGEALKRALHLGMVGDSDAVGETLCADFRERFEEQACHIEASLPATQSLQGLSLGDAPQTLSTAICGELRLVAREYYEKPTQTALAGIIRRNRVVGVVDDDDEDEDDDRQRQR